MSTVKCQIKCQMSFVSKVYYLFVVGPFVCHYNVLYQKALNIVTSKQIDENNIEETRNSTKIEP